MTLTGALLALGIAATLAGLGAIGWCVLAVRAARREGEAAIRARMPRVIVVNMAALAASTIGLMLVIAGLVLRA